MLGIYNHYSYVVEVEGIEPSLISYFSVRDVITSPLLTDILTISPPYKAKSCGMSLPVLHVCSPNSSRSLSLQYRSYLRPTNRWHYGSVDYLDPLCTTALYFTFAGLALHKYTLCRHIISRLVTPPSLRFYLLLSQRSLRVHRLYRGH